MMNTDAACYQHKIVTYQHSYNKEKTFAANPNKILNI